MRALAFTLTQPTPPTLTQRNSRNRGFGWWPDEPKSQCLEVLHDGSEVELVAGAGQAAKAHALEAVMGLQVRKAHLDPFSRAT